MEVFSNFAMGVSIHLLAMPLSSLLAFHAEAAEVKEFSREGEARVFAILDELLYLFAR